MHDSHRGLGADPLAQLHDPLVLILADELQRLLQSYLISPCKSHIIDHGKEKKASKSPEREGIKSKALVCLCAN